uniref:Uncharacterized protein n=1 Tax=Salix viminalis TaxID=40686 RepID=A0A6N2KDL9_SALVM
MIKKSLGKLREAKHEIAQYRKEDSGGKERGQQGPSLEATSMMSKSYETDRFNEVGSITATIEPKCGLHRDDPERTFSSPPRNPTEPAPASLSIPRVHLRGNHSQY